MSEFLTRFEELDKAAQDGTARWGSASKSGMGSDPDNPEWVAIVHNMVEARSNRDRLFINKAPEIIALVKAAREMRAVQQDPSQWDSMEGAWLEFSAALEALDK